MLIRTAIRILVLCLCLGATVLAQSLSDLKLSEAKVKLEKLQGELFAIDAEQQRETAELSSHLEQKGEFETTKQFEERKSKRDEMFDAVERKNQRKRDEVRGRMNEIFAAEYSGDLKLLLGPYDADAQRFSVSTHNGVRWGNLNIPLADAPKFKDSFAKAITKGSLGLLLNENNKAQEYVISAEVNTGGKTFPVTPEPLTQWRAMALVFGNYQRELVLPDDSSETETSIWNRPYPHGDVDSFDYYPILFVPFKENGIEKYVLVAQSSSSTYHDETLAVFARRGGQWRVDLILKDAGFLPSRLGSEASLVKIGPDRFAVKFDHASFAQESLETYWRIDGKFPLEILSLQTRQGLMDYYGKPVFAPAERIEFNSVVTILSSLSNGFYDKKVVTKGKKAKLIGKRWVMTPFNKTEVYVYSDGGYRQTTVKQ